MMKLKGPKCRKMESNRIYPIIDASIIRLRSRDVMGGKFILRLDGNMNMLMEDEKKFTKTKIY